MTAKFDVSTLNWVKGEIDASLDQARLALEAFVSTPDDETQMGFCVMHLHQVRGTLQMVELYGAARAADEMELLAVALQEKRSNEVERACEVLMRAVLQLPDYLEGLQGGQADNALVLLPLINEMRRLRGESPLPESDFFQPDLAVMPPSSTASGIDIRALAQKARPYYQSSLLHLLRGEEIPHSLKTLRALSDKLLAAATEPALRQWFWVFGGFVESLAEGGQVIRTAAKRLLSNGEQLIRQIGDGGEHAVKAESVVSALTSMLFQVAQAHGGGARLAELKAAFGLGQLLAGGSAPASIGGFNAELKKTLAGDVLEELATIQDALDIFVRSESREAASLLPLVDTMARLASTLAMMGQTSLQQALERQAAIISELQGAETAPGDDVLMGIASAVLAVDSALRDWGSVRPLEQADDLAGQVGAGELSPEAEAEHQRVIRQVMKEARSNLLRVKDAVDAFVATPADAALLAPLPGLLHEIIGSLSLLSYIRAAQVLRATSLYISNDLAKAEVLPGADLLDALADALTSIEYYMDAFVESRVHPAMVLEVAERAVAKLGYPVDALPMEAVEEPAAGLEEEIELAAAPEEIVVAAPPEEVAAEPAAAVAPPVTAAPAPAVAAAAASAGLDPEIVEIFIEEATEEIGKIGEFLPRWQTNRGDTETLRDLRRSFHTLKGSGRLVGAMRIGEFAWAFENMLNRVIDNTVEPGNAMFDLLDQAAEALPELVAEFREGTPVRTDVEWLQKAAGAMSEPGGLEAILPSAPSAPEVVEAVPEASAEVSIEAPALPELDPALLEIYGHETETHLATVEHFVTDCRSHAGCRVTEGLTRALHTLAGSSRMAGVFAVADVASPLEKYAKALVTANTPVSEEGQAALESCVALTRDMLAFLQGERTTPPEHQALQAQAEALHHAGLRLAEGLEDIPEAGLAQAPEPEPVEEAITLEVPVFEPAAEESITLEAEPELTLPEEEAITLEAVEAELPEEEAITLEAVEAELPEEEGITLEALLEPAVEEEAPPLEEILSAIAVEELPSEPAFEMPSFELAAPAAVLPEYDQDLLDIFLEEGAEIIDASEESLQAWRDHPDDRSLVEALQRQLHTLKGGARMAGVAPIGDLSHTLESIFEDIVEGRLTRSSEMFDLLQRAHDRLVTMLDQVRNNTAVTSADDLISRILALTGAKAPVAEEPVTAAAPLYVFLEQAESSLEVYGQQLHAWDGAPNKQPLLQEMEQQLRRLKGAARDAGIASMGDVAHSAELMLGAVADGHVPLSERMFALLQRTHDRLATMADQLRAGTAPIPDAVLIEAMDDLVAESRMTQVALPQVLETVPQPAVEISQTEEESELDRERDRRRGQRLQQDLVRVRADLLDNLVNFAGEVSIYRSRVEQQVGGVNYSLRDFGEILDRMHEQLRQFAIETEAQMQSRYEEVDSTEYEDFDPLEFDRFTHMQQLSRSAMESLNDLVEVQQGLQGITRETETLLLQQARVSTELQEGLMHTRMMPLVEHAPRLRRIVRQTSAELSKEVELSFRGAEVEMDRHMVERMLAPIEHLLRNAIAHGIETPEQRRRAGKPPRGQITLAQVREGSEVVLRIIDDGAGINLDRVRQKAIERGLMKADAGLSDKEVVHFILESGFSTAETLTQVAGRGVGMDVVNSEIKQLGGLLEIDTRPGAGTTFTVRLPLTLSVSRSLLVQAGEETYAVPMTSIQGIERLDHAKLNQLLAVEHPIYNWLGQEYELLPLAETLGLPPAAATAAAEGEVAKRPLLFAHSGDHYVAWAADNLLGSREIVVKSLGPQLSKLRGLSGATILGDGSVALILDLPLLARLGLAQRSTAVVEAAPVSAQPLVMVVDDSITVRKVTSRLLERNDMRPVTAKDGVDAIAQLEDVMPDVMLLDIEMPRMDGYELATHIRNTERLKHIPIIMITSRSGEKHRQRAMEIGVDFYMSKPYQETELLENIHKLIAQRRGT